MRTIGLLFIAFAAASTGCSKFRSQSPREFSTPDGRFTIVMPGTPHFEEMTVAGMRTNAYSTNINGEEHWVTYADIPLGIRDDLDAHVSRMCKAVEGTDLDTRGSNDVVSGQGFREFEFRSAKYGWYLAGRVVIARQRVYRFFCTGPNARLSNPEVMEFLNSFRLTDGPTPGRNEPGASGTGESSGPPSPSNGSAKITPGKTSRPNRPPSSPTKPQILGSGFDPEFQDVAPAGGLLVGFDIGYGFATNSNNDMIVAIRPTYRVGDTDQMGQIHGTETKRAIRELARPGYAVGGITARTGGGVDGFYITYMKVVGDQLDPNDAYNSRWLGGAGGNGQASLGGNGTPIVGIIGRQNKKDLSAIGLVYGLTPTQDLPGSDKIRPGPPAPRIPKGPRFVGGWVDPEFQEAAPEGGMLVGFYIGLGNVFNKDKIAAIQPTYEVRGQDVFGQVRGKDTRRAIKERAKPGYAVGAISVKGGLWVEGFSITYMRVLDNNRLDPTDSYESDWFGAEVNPEEIIRISGDGTPAIGFIGRQNVHDINAMGLLFPDQ